MEILKARKFSVHVQNIKLNVEDDMDYSPDDIDQFLEKQGIHNEHDIHDLPNCKQVKRKSVISTTSLDQFQKNKGYT
ncbi:hypothetical protein H5410_030967 [Solanum commersonii]|uniref:Uncharacterized protein n=1 Tax=Solanum commersonii TaxID=4109 RepID=A0A9J5YHR6_SOLCO|nr:hypothetical protein H5410_030967 [Solanum commersonii]